MAGGGRHPQRHVRRHAFCPPALEEVAMETIFWIAVVLYVLWHLRQMLRRASR